MENQFKKPSDYELKAIKQIHSWKNPQITWFDSAMKIVRQPISSIEEYAKKLPGYENITISIDNAISKSIGGLLTLLNDMSQSTINPEDIYKKYQKMGYDVNSASDILKLDLEDVDKTIGYLDTWYKSLAAVEGGAAGAAGILGIPADVVAITGLNMRAIGEYAVYCGLDVTAQQERLYALNVLGFATSPSDASKQFALAHLTRIAVDIAKKKKWKQLEEYAFVQIVKKIATALGIRLTKAKLSQIIPYTGAFIGGGFNAYYTNKVCDSAFYLYRERFLAEKYGADIIDIVVKPSENLDDFGEDEEL